MKFWISVIMATTILIAPAAADPLRVISGDHLNFTRIVLPLPRGVNWTVDRTDREVIITYPEHQDGFNDDSVFEKIMKSRVQSVSGTSSSFKIEFSCDCEVGAFVTGTGYLVVDIADPGLPVISPVTKTQHRDNSVLKNSHPINSDANYTSLPWIRSRTPQVDITPKEYSPNGFLDIKQSMSNSNDLRESPAVNNLAQTQTQLIEEIASAASSGILTSYKFPSATRSPSMPTSDGSIQVSEVPKGMELSNESGNIRFSTSIDQPTQQERGYTSNLSGETCPESEDYAVETWGEPENFQSQIGALRIQLYGEFDRLNHDIARELAQTYVYFGFGLEAASILNLSPETLKVNAPILAIAEIMETGALVTPFALDRYADCDSNVALWALLSQEIHPSEANHNSAAALRALNKLPVHLRQIVAPATSERFLRATDRESAAAAMRSIERLPGTIDLEGQLAQSNLSLEDGDTETGQQGLSKILTSNTRQSPEALIRFVESKLEHNQPISTETTELVTSYALEYRNSELGHRLHKAQAVAFAKSDQFDAAFATLDQLHSQDDDVPPDTIRATLLNELTRSASDIVFLDHVFQQSANGFAVLQPNDRAALARRVLSLGFLQKARTILFDTKTKLTRSNDRLLAAEIALRLNLLGQAKSVLGELRTEEANLLRAQAMELSGLNDKAYEIYQKNGKDVSATDAAWLSSRWTDLINEEDERFGSMAVIAQRPIVPITNQEGMLVLSTAALEESARTRKLLKLFLEDTVETD